MNPMAPEDVTPAASELPFRPGPATVLAPPPERVEPLNLARRPFLNSRPVVRVALLLWLLGLALLLVDLWQFLGYRERSADKRTKIAGSEADIERQRAYLARLQKTLGGFDLDAQNQKVDFLNKQIAERTFSWSQLLDRITERLPHDLRLNRLTPLTGDKADRLRSGSASSVRRSARADDLVPLLITGESRNDEALLSFVDNLFKPPFMDANLAREEREEDGKTLKFEISVQYRPGMPAAASASPGAATPAPKIEELPMPSGTAPAAPAVPGGAAPKASA
ncbi:MAG TPA: hypothetical protein VIJ26_01345, partial [Thermoanaerobaculia bacterium]